MTKGKATPASVGRGKIENFFRKTPATKQVASTPAAESLPSQDPNQENVAPAPASAFETKRKPDADVVGTHVAMEVDAVAPEQQQQQPEVSSTRKRAVAGLDRGPQSSAKRPKSAPAAAPPSPVRICLSSCSSQSDDEQNKAAGHVGSNHVGAQHTSQAADCAAESGAQEQSTSQVYQMSSSQAPLGIGASTHGETAAAGDSQGQPGAKVGAPSDTPCSSYTVAELQTMIEDVRAALEQEMLLPLCGSPTAQVAAFVEGRRCTLTDLMHGLEETIAAATATAAPADTAVSQDGFSGSQGALSGDSASPVTREQILVLASRKAYGVKEGLPDGLAAADDCDPEALWFWELRDLKKALLPPGPNTAAGVGAAGTAAGAAQAAVGAGAALGGKGVSAAASAAATSNRKMAELYRKRRKELHDRWAAAAALLELLSKAGASSTTELVPPAGSTGAATAPAGVGGSAKKAPSKTMQQRASKAVAKLDKLPSLAQVEACLEAGLLAVGEKDSGRLAQMEAKRKERQAAAAARAAEKEAKEREKAERLAEKAALKEKEREQREKDKAAKALKAVGFKDSKDLEKTQAVMANFFKLSSKAPNLPTAGGGTQALAPAQPATEQAPGAEDPMEGVQGPGAGPGGSNSPGSLERRLRGERLEAWLKEQAATLDQALPGTEDGRAAAADIPAIRTCLLAAWKRQARLQRAPLRGSPPTWARRPGPQPSLHERCVALWGEGYQASAVRLVRRKLLAFSENTRPAYYGSWSRESTSVRPRKFLARDTTLDYDMDSDEEWEEEPEGTDIDACNSDDDASDLRQGGDGAEEDEEEGFVVDDGYLSGDEGVKLDEDMDLDLAPPGPVAGGIGADPRMVALEAGVLRALRSNRPLVLSQLTNAKCDPPSTLDSRLLKVLCGSYLKPNGGLVLAKDSDIWTAPARPVKEDAAARSSGASLLVSVGGTVGVSGSGTPGGVLEAAGSQPGAAPGSTSGSRGRKSFVMPDALVAVLQRYLRQTTEKSIDKVIDGFYMTLGYKPQGQLAAAPASTEAGPSTQPGFTPATCVQTTTSTAALHGLNPGALPPRIPKAALKEKIRSLATYGGASKGWVLNTEVTVTPNRPASTSGVAVQSTLFRTPDAAGSTPGSTLPTMLHTGSAAGPLPTPAVRAAAHDLLAGMPLQQAPLQAAGAPTPCPTPGTTFPVPGGSLAVPASVGSMGQSGFLLPGSSGAMAAGHAAGAQPNMVRQGRLWAPAPAGRVTAAGRHSAQGTPLSPIPCALESVASLAQQTAVGASATPATGQLALRAPANTPTSAGAGSAAPSVPVACVELQQMLTERGLRDWQFQELSTTPAPPDVKDAAVFAATITVTPAEDKATGAGAAASALTPGAAGGVVVELMMSHGAKGAAADVEMTEAAQMAPVGP